MAARLPVVPRLTPRLVRGWAVLPLALALALPPGSGRAEEPGERSAVGTFSGPWRSTETRDGLVMTATGNIRLRVDPIGGRFTCTFSGSMHADGDIVTGGKPSHVTAQGTVASSSCGGSYSPLDGTLDGRYEYSGSISLAVTVSVENADEPGKPRTETRRSSVGSRGEGALKGLVAATGASGYWLDDGDDETKKVRWRASGSFPVVAADAGEDDDKGAGDDKEPDAGDEERQRAKAKQKMTAGAPLSSLLAEIDDPAVRASVAAEFLAYKRDSGETDRAKLEETFRDIRTKHRLVADLEDATRLLQGRGGQPLGPAEAEAVDGLVSRVWSWARGKDGKAVEAMLGHFRVGLEERGGGRGPAVDATVGAARKTTAEVARVERRIQAINDRLKRGEIDADSARTLKGMVMLGNGLADVTRWSQGEEAKRTDFGVGVRRVMRSSERKEALQGDCCGDATSECCLDKIDRGVVTGF
ncbi:MAG: hypothetical protein EP329_04105 [Deltaproteobacteria bacterium]|nr:MAG: hypothetical protein EP329_04105 [Deltaproteobacteria bacterium]